MVPFAVLPDAEISPLCPLRRRGLFVDAGVRCFALCAHACILCASRKKKNTCFLSFTSPVFPSQLKDSNERGGIAKTLSNMGLYHMDSVTDETLAEAATMLTPHSSSNQTLKVRVLWY